ncbi:MAG: hypothetical protein F6K22_08990 [Okeania sp. SIO2F4]|uniref:hypothetical protein n=1 Tax=Okeania sp. SIO2F4 TaxID=2607790 RepID=UPI00142B7255|nr:hypothetical protein [Okeania sp. SIO2F4]NES02969.1 hypothetical protein [Okeania sp. SIO2F4]
MEIRGVVRAVHDQSISFKLAQVIVVAIASILSGYLMNFFWLLALPVVPYVIGCMLLIGMIYWGIWASFYWKIATYFNSPEWYPWLVLIISLLMICYGFWSFK